MKGGTSKVMAEGCAGVGQAWREQFVQKGAHMQNSWGIENCADCLDGGWRAVGREQTGAGSTCRNRGHIVNSVVNNPPANAGDVGSTPGLRRSPAEGNGNLLQYSCLENPMDRGAWWAIVHGVAKSWT